VLPEVSSLLPVSREEVQWTVLKEKQIKLQKVSKKGEEQTTSVLVKEQWILNFHSSDRRR